jgi:hypothetical protein
MTAALHQSMHQDHRLWEGEIHFWRDNVAEWQKELTQARDRIKELEAAIQTQEETLRKYAASIRLDEQRADEHEHALAEFERGEPGENLLRLAPKHQAEAKHHAEQREKHEQLKRRQHRFISHLQLLVDSLKDLAKR